MPEAFPYPSIPPEPALTAPIIPFNVPYATGKETGYIQEAITRHHLSGDGPFTHQCSAWLEQNTGTAKALLTHSCTAALEMSALLIDLEPGDEVIMPSYTFVSTANAFVLRGAVPVFVDIRADTLNLDETLIEAAITPRTKAICVVHYAGVSCEMDTVLDIARRHGLKVVEDAAQGVMSTYKGRALGAIGDLGAYSFHATKNIISGEGGALLVRDPDLALQAEIIREKGTNRARFFRGEVDKYTWEAAGSSYLPSELIAAYLWAQLQEAEAITQARMKTWNLYHSLLQKGEKKGLYTRPTVPAECQHNAHMYYIVLKAGMDRGHVLAALRAAGIHATFHYVPLHSAPAGLRFGRAHGSLSVTDVQANSLIRLPLWNGLSEGDCDRIVKTLNEVLGH